MRVPKPYEARQMVEYELAKWRWVREHPHATPEQYQAAIRQICKRLGL